MDIGAILVGIGLLVGVTAYVARPLFKRTSNGPPERSDNANSRAQLTARRDAIYALIHELDADYQTGKVNDQDYRPIRELYVAEGVSILKQLDALPSTDSQADLDAAIEGQVLALRQARASFADDGQEAATRFCTQCGHPADPENRFCAQCGAALKGVATQ